MRKLGVREAFSRAAPYYDTYADVQRQAGLILADYLPEIAPCSILELGCATGSYTLSLLEAFPAAEILALDFSAALLAIAEKKLSGFPHIRFLCTEGDEFLRTSPRTFDLITANATLQWFANLPITIAHMAKRTAAGGVMLASLFGPRTFYELGAALAAVYGDHPPLPAALFPGKEALLAMLTPCYTGVELDERTVQRTYSSTLELLRHIRRTGTTGGRRQGQVFTPTRLHMLDDWFQHEYGGCTVTYQIFFIRARKRNLSDGQ